MNTTHKKRGVALMALGVSCLTCGEAILKFLTSTYTPFQILLLRSLIVLFLLLLVWKKDKPFSEIFQVNIKDQLIRNGVLTLALVLAIYSLSLIPLFQYSSLFFSSPFFIIIFSILLLDEKVNKTIWLSLAAGFLGVVLVFNPSSDFFLEFGCIAALLSAVFYGLGIVLTSKLSRVNSPLLMTLWYTGVCLVVGLCGSLGSAFSFHGEDVFLFLLAALLNIGANFAITKSFQCAQASYLAPLEYLAIPLSALLGYLIWTQLPEEGAVIGSLFIVASGLYIFKKEKKQLDGEKKETVALSGDSL